MSSFSERAASMARLHRHYAVETEPVFTAVKAYNNDPTRGWVMMGEVDELYYHPVSTIDVPLLYSPEWRVGEATEPERPSYPKSTEEWTVPEIKFAPEFKPRKGRKKNPRARERIVQRQFSSRRPPKLHQPQSKSGRKR